MNIDKHGKPTLLAQDRSAMDATASIFRTLSAMALVNGNHSASERHRTTADQIQAAMVDYSPKEVEKKGKEDAGKDSKK